jgi:glycosyltransferase involved in cell wall biosynthesis
MLSIIIPAFNEEKRLPECLEKTINFALNQKYTTEIIVVCDGCTDGTVTICNNFQNTYTNLKVIQYSPNRGKGFAVKRGMLEARGNTRLFMDADCAVPIETVTNFLMQIEEGYDIVIGARGLKDTKIIAHQKILREAAGKLFGRFQKLVLGIPFHDTQCGFKLFTRKAAEFIFPMLNYECSYFDAELIYIAYNNKLKIKEMPVVWRHDGMTRMPIGVSRTIDLFRKLFNLKYLHKKLPESSNE